MGEYVPIPRKHPRHKHPQTVTVPIRVLQPDLDTLRTAVEAAPLTLQAREVRHDDDQGSSHVDVTYTARGANSNDVRRYLERGGLVETRGTVKSGQYRLRTTSSTQRHCDCAPGTISCADVLASA